jgi:hypothetical protein
MTGFKFYITLALIGFAVYYFNNWTRKTEKRNRSVTITKVKLQIYYKYDGNIDGLIKYGQEYEKGLFENNDWGTISGYLHDLELIKKGLTSAEFQNRIVQELQIICDKQSFNDLTKGLS